MKNIHVLPTDKPSRLHTYKRVLNLAAGEFVSPTIIKNDLINLNIYITSDLEIKEGDWCVDIYKLKNNHNPIFKWSDKFKVDAKKIILTTDQDLIKDSVQVIDDKFLEWFVKNPNCEKIEIKTRYLHSYKTGETFISFSKTPEFSSRNMQCIKIEPRYEIIIPQEEPKQENCCTPVNQIKRYVDCVGCDRKPKQMSKQTAIDYLFNKLIANPGNFIKAYKQAKEMEKEQMWEYIKKNYCIGHNSLEFHRLEFEQYYNETYKKEEK